MTEGQKMIWAACYAQARMEAQRRVAQHADNRGVVECQGGQMALAEFDRIHAGMVKECDEGAARWATEALEALIDVQRRPVRLTALVAEDLREVLS